jgi:hypothetical protein
MTESGSGNGGYTSADSTNIKMMSGNFMSLFEKRDGKYICIRDMGSSDIPNPKNKKFRINLKRFS